MKTKFHLLSWLLMLAVASVLTGCADDGPPYPDYLDERLLGTWELVAVNGTPVGEWETNFLCFDGSDGYSASGTGGYAYYLRGQLMVEDIWYVCSNSGGPQGQQITIQYESGDTSTMDYWFSSPDTLVLQWWTSTGSVVYTYMLTDDFF